ncbi:MAG: MFS transporter, partial [Alphaproteobacteria bacterium]|nr:MFS transporter [Alphaproteobacteria bacterium]
MQPGKQAGLALIIALGVTQTLAWASSYYVPAILARPMARDLGLSVPAAFGALSLALLIAGICGPAAGRWIDRRGGRGMLCLSNLVFAAGLCAMAFAQTALHFYLAWAIMGLAMAIGLYETAFATLATNFGPAARGSITGISLIAGLASTVGWPI